MVDLVREVVDQRIQRTAVLACAIVFEAVRKFDDLFEISSRILTAARSSRLLRTHWLSLSTRSAKLSAPSITGTPASSVDHLDIDSSDVFEVCYRRVCEVHRQKSRLWSAVLNGTRHGSWQRRLVPSSLVMIHTHITEAPVDAATAGLQWPAATSNLC